MNRLLGAVLLVAALAAGMWVQRWVQGTPGAFEPPAQGPYPRPAFSLPDLDSGQRRSIAEWDGKKVVLNFWASWCAPCLEEMPLFVDLQRRHGGRGVQFVGVAMDAPQAARAMARRLALNYPSLVGELEAMDVARAYGNAQGVLPYTVLIGRDGRVEGLHAGVASGAELERWLTAP